MDELPGPRYLTVAPVREENPEITVITGLEGPVLPCRPLGWSETEAEPEAGGEE